MNSLNVFELRNKIIQKAEQIKALALVSQVGNVEELTVDDIESLFSLFIDLSGEVKCLADHLYFPVAKAEAK